MKNGEISAIVHNYQDSKLVYDLEHVCFNTDIIVDQLLSYDDIKERKEREEEYKRIGCKIDENSSSRDVIVPRGLEFELIPGPNEIDVVCVIVIKGVDIILSYIEDATFEIQLTELGKKIQKWECNNPSLFLPFDIIRLRRLEEIFGVKIIGD